ncbi:hypothetical protein [Chlorobium phaeovibrioides]|uniref:hypothetical protein n=1 Tax=Chlorobium phaeovibrioides TaxID=1094 RepID=UPI00294FF3E0|nr:hypothetical protein [Chlorobium phaeovibrioides]
MHTRAIENKKAEWYSRRLTDTLQTNTEDEHSPTHTSGEQSDAARPIYCSSEEKTLLATLSREEILKDSAIRKRWWNALTADWKEVVKNTLKLVRDPSEGEIALFFDTTHLRCDNRRIHGLLPIRLLENWCSFAVTNRRLKTSARLPGSKNSSDSMPLTATLPLLNRYGNSKVSNFSGYQAHR